VRNEIQENKSKDQVRKWKIPLKYTYNLNNPNKLSINNILCKPEITIKDSMKIA